MKNEKSNATFKPGDIVEKDTLMCADYNVPINAQGICPECKIPHDMQSTYILKAGYPIPERPRRVLIVDDDVDVREGIARYLQMQGFEVVQEADGHLGFEVYRECFPFEFVLSDFQFIPGSRKSSCGCVIKNGADLVREIRKLIPAQKMAIMSGDAKVANKALDASVRDVPVVEKPFRMKQLMELLQKA